VIYLVRHGETDDNARRVVQGGIDTPLNDRGREQARELAARVGDLGIEAIWTSQLSRAAETAHIVGAELGIEPRVDDRLAESQRGSWEGRSLDEIERAEPEAWAAWKRGGADFRFPGGGESLAEHQARVLAVIDAIRAGDQPALVVAHGGTIRCAICANHPSGLQAFWSIPVPNAELIELGEASRA
jgi:2,3-bisphosphoglycerate-dependent phosphoglycerate mutase